MRPVSHVVGAGVRIWPKEVDFHFHRHQPEHRNGMSKISLLEWVLAGCKLQHPHFSD